MFRSAQGWQAISSEELLRRVAGLSTAFVELGVKPGDRVALFSANRPEWHVADFAITGAGGVTVPVYFNESPDRMAYILKHSGARFVFVAGATQMQKLGPASARLLLRYQASEMNRLGFASWEVAQLILGLVFFFFLLFGTREKKGVLAAALVPLVLVAVQRWRLILKLKHY
jgi:long-subunit acyl-CoA synthetase (AMP-forming)